MDLGGGPSRRRFRVHSRILAPHIATGSVSGSPVTGVLGNKLVTLGIRYCLRLFTLSTYSFGIELSYIISNLSSLRSVPCKYLSGRQQGEVESLTSAGEECNEEETVQSVSHGPLSEVFRPRCDIYDVGRLSGIAYPNNW
jgi:hypothetical protein